MGHIHKRLGKAIRYWRIDQKMTQKQLAKMGSNLYMLHAFITFASISLYFSLTASFSAIFSRSLDANPVPEKSLRWLSINLNNPLTAGSLFPLSA